MWVLILNPMRGRTEDREILARSYDLEALEAFLKQHWEPWSDVGEHSKVHHSDHIAQQAGGVVIDSPKPHTWHKTFRKGSPLEWYQCPLLDDPIQQAPSRDEFMEQQGRLWDEQFAHIREV